MLWMTQCYLIKDVVWGDSFQVIEWRDKACGRAGFNESASNCVIAKRDGREILCAVQPRFNESQSLKYGANPLTGRPSLFAITSSSYRTVMKGIERAMP